MLVVCLSTGLLLWAMTAKKCRTSAKKIPSKKGSKIVQSLGIHVEVQKKKRIFESKIQELMAFLPFTSSHGTHQVGAPFAMLR